eukprot:scaffold347_cov380-Prasinococcus_capsulatus_cf.AAC.8
MDLCVVLRAHSADGSLRSAYTGLEVPWRPSGTRKLIGWRVSHAPASSDETNSCLSGVQEGADWSAVRGHLSHDGARHTSRVPRPPLRRKPQPKVRAP